MEKENNFRNATRATEIQNLNIRFQPYSFSKNASRVLEIIQGIHASFI